MPRFWNGSRWVDYREPAAAPKLALVPEEAPVEHEPVFEDGRTLEQVQTDSKLHAVVKHAGALPVPRSSFSWPTPRSDMDDPREED
jgi:hypothetical protein